MSTAMDLEDIGIVQLVPGQSNLSKNNSADYVKNILDTDLRKNVKQSLENDLRWNFILDKNKLWQRKTKSAKKKKIFLTRSERTKFNLLNLPKSGWNYDDLHIMRQQWKDYMRRNCHMLSSGDEITRSNVNITLAKCEFIGAEITIIRSQISSVIGIMGTIVLETKSVFQVVTVNSELKSLLKKPSVFTFNLDGTVFTIFGKHLIIRPSERSIKKIKSQISTDL